MAKLIRLIALLSINILLQYADCIREKRGISDFLIPGINVGDIAIDQIKYLVFGKPVDKDQIIMDRQIEHIETTREILSLTQEIVGLLENTPETTVMIQSLQKFPTYMDSIDDSFREYETLEISGRNASDYQVLQFARNSINRYVGPIKNINNLHSLVVPSKRAKASKKDYTLLSLISRHIRGYKSLCNMFRSQQQIGQTFFAGITSAEYKTFFIMEYSMRKLAEVHSLNYETEKENLMKGLKRRLKNLGNAFESIMKEMSREVWRCDPEEHVEDETYFKMTVFQTYLARDRDLRGSTTCYYGCNYFKESFHYRCSNLNVYSDPNVNYLEYTACKSVRMCAGNVYNCWYKFDQPDLWSCIGTQNSSRRYQYFSHGFVDKYFGRRSITNYGINQGTCNTKLTYDAATRKDRNGYECEVCLCTCDDSPSPYADAKINIRPVTADKDYVITGLKWVKKDHTLHIQIEQGRIHSRGEIDPETVEWKDIEEPRDKNDTALISYKGINGFLLEDIQLEEGKAMTGIKLEIVKNKNAKLVTFRLLGTPYEWKTGKLLYPNDIETPFYDDPDESLSSNIWDSPIKLPENFPNSVKADLGYGRVPSLSNKPSEPIDSSKKYIQLGTSEFDSDIGQNTIPFFEMQENIQIPSFPLAGVGIYLKRIGEYAGFLSLKLLTFDISPYLMEKL